MNGCYNKTKRFYKKKKVKSFARIGGYFYWLFIAVILSVVVVIMDLT